MYRLTALHFLGALILLVMSSMQVASDDLSTMIFWLNRAVIAGNGEVAKIAEALTPTVTRAGDPHLIRWNKVEISLGIQITNEVPARTLDALTERLIQSFAAVKRTLKPCLRIENLSSHAATDYAIAPCNSSETDVDLVFDMSIPGSTIIYGVYLKNWRGPPRS